MPLGEHSLITPKLASVDHVSSFGEAEADALVAVTSKEGLEQLRSRFAEARVPIELGDFDASLGQTVLVYTSSSWRRLVLAGMGSDSDWEDCVERVRVAVASAVRLLRGYGNVRRAAIAVDESIARGRCGVDSLWLYEQALTAAHLANYAFSYRSRTSSPHTISSFTLVADDVAEKEARRLTERALKVSEAVYIARNIANAPANAVNPDTMELIAYEASRTYSLRLTVLRAEDLRSIGLNGIVAVGSGSDREPRLIILEHHGGGNRIAVVGKAVAFDAGGLDLKSPSAMQDMKYDKSGGAAALAVAVAASTLGLPITVVAAIPVVENLPSGRAYKPRDVVRMYSGYTVEICNTDAEGRIILADAMAYVASKYSPSAIVDLATLTGAIVVALGNHAAGLFSNDDELAARVEASAWRVWEPVWRMPLWKPYHRQLESDVADTSNVGGTAAGAITAAAFLQAFAEGRPWAHLDIAGVAWVHEKGPDKPYYPKGATGWGVRTLVDLLSFWKL